MRDLEHERAPTVLSSRGQSDQGPSGGDLSGLVPGEESSRYSRLGVESSPLDLNLNVDLHLRPPPKHPQTYPRPPQASQAASLPSLVRLPNTLRTRRLLSLELRLPRFRFSFGLLVGATPES